MTTRDRCSDDAGPLQRRRGTVAATTRDRFSDDAGPIYLRDAVCYCAVQATRDAVCDVHGCAVGRAIMQLNYKHLPPQASTQSAISGINHEAISGLAEPTASSPGQPIIPALWQV